MKCNCCDRDLSDPEIIWNKELGKNGEGAFELCSTCLEAAMDAAYSDGFVREEEKFEDLGIWEPLEEPELPFVYGNNRNVNPDEI